MKIRKFRLAIFVFVFLLAAILLVPAIILVWLLAVAGEFISNEWKELSGERRTDRRHD